MAEANAPTTPAEELTCKQLVELVTDYFEGALPPEQRARFEAHLARCRGCQAYLSQLRRTIRILGSLTEEAISSPAREHLLRAFRDWKSA